MTISHHEYYCDLCKKQIFDYDDVCFMKIDNRKGPHNRVRLYLDLCETCFNELVNRYENGGKQE